ncbi:lysylphosphatidylglycerol synthase transmembrane domain-containing protein [Actinoallomurus rhizosphaericola]|uniref:lysylphosphatidylglycerol synthase transmembrane domain-containing protein n=1 Tax=Actinoallomurus rhizosphaericola TaxID=2952536 RepID=UPI00209392FE|nr:lysylphosphatidylglycerol synthase transmembrane domain-containing protein [Actinoallomurus rhizosphaericola]MCO5995200.1 flippase-like domain-containing protein [Actinoallomurus rhizosphaericola]
MSVNESPGADRPVPGKSPPSTGTEPVEATARSHDAADGVRPAAENPAAETTAEETTATETTAHERPTGEDPAAGRVPDEPPPAEIPAGETTAGGGPAVGGPAGEVRVEEPSLPRRIRRPSDAIRFLLTVGLIGLILVLAHIARHTTSGLASDIASGTERAPHLLLTLANLASGIGVLAVPVAFGVARVIGRDGLRVVIGVVAAVVALGVSLGLDSWMTAAGMRDLAWYLTWKRHGGWFPGPAHIDLTPVIAYVTAVGLGGRTRWQLATWGVIGLDAVASLTTGAITPLAVLTTYLIGRAVGYGTLYAVGAPNIRPPGDAVVAALRRVGLAPVRAARVAAGPEDTRRYTAALADGRTIDVTVLDRDQQTAGLLYRLWRRARLRGEMPRRTIRSLRRSLEQESLMSYATTAAGAATPRLLATSEVGSEAALLAYEHVPGRLLADLPDEELTDDLLVGVWTELKLLQDRRLAHRLLVSESILVDESGRPHLVDLRGGEIAAGDLVLRVDLAQLLTELALRVGAERTVRTAAAVLGADALGAAVPLLQKVVLARSTRNALRRDKKLLSRIREQIRVLRPELVTAAQPLRLDRFRPRTLVSVVAGMVGAYLLLSQLGNVNLAHLVTHADWRWFAVGALASAASYLAAALMLMGFVPERLPLGRTILVQLVASFIKLVAPAAVGGIAVNTRYLQRAGVPAGQAAASVGASQLTGMASHILMLALFGYITGSNYGPSLPPSRIIIVSLLGAAVLAIILLSVGPLRRLVAARMRSMFSGVLPRLLDVLQSPKKLATGLGGTLLLTAAFVACLDASIRAFGGSMSLTTVAVVFLTGNALGSAAPTPGGLGAVEGALSLGLTLAGLPAGTATSAVLLFRLHTFWLPVLPGWASLSYLQRKEAI